MLPAVLPGNLLVTLWSIPDSSAVRYISTFGSVDPEESSEHTRRAAAANSLPAKTSPILCAKIVLPVVDVLLCTSGNVLQILTFVFFGHIGGGDVAMLLMLMPACAFLIDRLVLQ